MKKGYVIAILAICTIFIIIKLTVYIPVINPYKPPIYRALTSEQITEFIKAKNINVLDIKQIDKHTLILFRNSDKQGVYALISDESDRVSEGGSFTDNNESITPISIGGGARGGEGKGDIQYVYVIINQSHLLQSANKIKFTIDGKEITESIKNKQGLLLPGYTLGSNSEIRVVLFDDNGKVIREVLNIYD